MLSSRSSTWTLNNVGDTTDPWGTPEGKGLIDDRAPPNFTSWLLPSRKLRIHSQKLFDTFFWASFLKRKPSSSRSIALQKSINNYKTWIPILSSREFSVLLNQFWLMLASADTVDLPCVNACWLSLILRSPLFNLSWMISKILASCGNTEIWRKSLSMSLSGYTLGTGVTNACLYRVGYLAWKMLEHLMLWITGEVLHCNVSVTMKGSHLSQWPSWDLDV